MSMHIGGAETHILELCRELKKRDCEITLASFGGVYADELEKLGVLCVKLPLNTKHPVSVIKSYNGLEKLIRDGDFDIVHAHARIPAFIVGLLHDKLTDSDGRKFRFVTTAHLNFSVNPLWRKISRWGEQVMAVSSDIADYLTEEYGCPRSRIQLTINGVDTKKFSADTPFDAILEKHSLERERFRVVYMSRLDADRADPAYRLLSIAPKISEKYPNTDIIIVGGGSEFDKLNEIARRINKNACRNLVTMTGSVSNTNEYCAAADIFIGVSRSALEAMSAAKPVIIAGNQGALGIFEESKIADAVNTNFCCRGFDVETEESLLADISSLIDMSAEDRAKMGAFNRDFIYKNYTACRMADDYIKMYEKTLASPVQFKGDSDVIMSGYYGFGNLGDESLLDIITSKLAENLRGVKIAALTKNPREDSKRTGLRCISRFNMIGIPREISRTKILISGGGSLLQDSTSKRSLRYYAGIILCAQLRKTKTCVFANGIGPISYPSNKKIAAKVVKNADYLSVRDSYSADELERLGVDRDSIRVTADPAFLIKPSLDARVEEILNDCGIEEGAGLFALSLRPMSLSSKRKNNILTFEDEVIVKEGVRICTICAEKYGLIPLIIPMQETHDTSICREICEKSNCGAVMYIPEGDHELIGIIARARFVIGMRLHSIIYASSAGVPVIGLSYDPKVKSVMHELGQDFIVDLERENPLFADRAACFVDEIEKNHSKIAEELKNRAAEMRDRAEEDIKQVCELIKG